MAQYKKPTRKAQKILAPGALSHSEFRWFVLHFPTLALKRAGVSRPSFVAVGMTLAQFGDYETGTRVNPSKKALHRLTGAHHETITKVLDVLKTNGAIEVVELHQGRNGGQPSEVFEFRRSPEVEKVLSKRDAEGWTERASATGEPGSATGEPGSATGEPGSATGEHNRNLSNVMNDKNRSVADAPSPASSDADSSKKNSLRADEIHLMMDTQEEDSSWLDTKDLDALLADL
ncbi:hypothetical protein [Microbacterium allomyrinae]|uniref:Uncharacterized protein n=1 Tax=Microbacterium allomyrinae TaxID=2830666 RepID=A0A9X1LTK9_9MICO|nr:hypothetical protein [Microbacterium allomyrinae]MCC2031942.1 hypothetical protein [Microbacterium allomyrinae]